MSWRLNRRDAKALAVSQLAAQAENLRTELDSRTRFTARNQFLSRFQLSLELIKGTEPYGVAVVNIDQAFVDGQFAPAVEYPSPASKVTQLAGPAQLLNGFRVKSFVVVDGKVRPSATT